jgi:hypothetical protein
VGAISQAYGQQSNNPSSGLLFFFDYFSLAAPFFALKASVVGHEIPKTIDLVAALSIFFSPQEGLACTENRPV